MPADYSDRFGYSPDLPDEIRIIFMWLCQYVAHIQLLWNFYLGLFANEDYAEIADLAIASFRIIEVSIRNDMVMSISRLCDPPKTLGKDNLSFQSLAQKCRSIDGSEELVSNFITACEPILKLRHKTVAHNDLYTRIDPSNNPLPGIGRGHIDEILRLAKDILNLILGHYVDAELSLNPIMRGGADHLIFWLKSGKQYQEDQDKRFR